MTMDKKNNYFTNYCRVCMVEIDVKICSNIFLTKFRLSTSKQNINDEDASVFMAEIIEKLTCVKLNEFDQFPKHICQPCEKRFIGACVFKQQLEWSTIKYNTKRKAENRERQQQLQTRNKIQPQIRKGIDDNKKKTKIKKYELEMLDTDTNGTAETLDNEIFTEFPAMAGQLKTPPSSTYKIMNSGIAPVAATTGVVKESKNTTAISNNNINIINVTGELVKKKNNKNNNNTTAIDNSCTIENIEIISDNNEIISCIEGKVEEDDVDEESDVVNQGVDIVDQGVNIDDDDDEHYQILIEEIKNESLIDYQSSDPDYQEIILIDEPKRKVNNKNIKKEKKFEQEDAIEFLTKYNQEDEIGDDDDDDENNDVGGDGPNNNNNSNGNVDDNNADDNDEDYGDEDEINIEIKKIRKLMKEKKLRKKIPDDPELKRHVCQICKKRFLRHSNLVDHLRLHANIKLFKCDVCSKSFVQKGNLDAHYRVHTKERPFACKICSRTYNQSSALAIHIKTHTREKDFECDICPKRFTNSSDLIKHKRIHDISTQFKCPGCESKTFAQRINLKTHIRKHHPHLVNVELVSPVAKKKK